MKQACKALLIALLVASGFAQESAPPKAAIPIIVTDSYQTPLSVTLESLVITDQKIPITGARLLRGSDLPVELGVLIDTSGSQRDAQDDDINKAARRFADAIIRRPEDRVFFLHFWSVPQVSEWLTKEQLQSYTMDKAQFGGGTALYDALFVACKKRMGPRDWRTPTRRVLLLISDGEDNLSHVTRDQAAAEALKAGAVIFTINNAGWNRPMVAEKTMDYWAKLTGGESFNQIHRKEMPNALASIQALMDGMYYLSYAPPDASKSSVHEVEVKPAPKEKFNLSYPTRYPWNP
jgi:Ca-activated chloride channel family protein